MNIFITGATGWVGSAIAADMLAAGHQVTGLARTPEKAAALEKLGVTPVLGSLDDLGTLQSQAETADAVIHTAFNHDFSRFAAADMFATSIRTRTATGWRTESPDLLTDLASPEYYA